MYWIKTVVVCLSISFVNSQLVQLDKNGGVGVNFGGYSATAGLGGFLTGNSADGGLHASAQTPHGQNAQAGLHGNTQSDGNLYASADSGSGYAAGAGLSVVKTVQPVGKYVATSYNPPPVLIHKQVEIQQPPPQPIVVEKHVQKIATPVVAAPVAPVTVEKHIEAYPVYPVKTIVRRPLRRNDVPPPPPPPPPTYIAYPARPQTGVVTTSVAVNKNGNFFNDIFNIPISTLKAVNQLVNNIAGGLTVSKQVGVSATATTHAHGATGGSAEITKTKVVA